MGKERHNVTLTYGPPRWYKVKYRKPHKDPNVKVLNTGLTEILTVAVSCRNGVEFISMDQYDSYLNTWMKHHPGIGQHVIAWAKIDLPWSTNAPKEVNYENASTNTGS